MNNRRLSALGLDDYQMREVQRIEGETRQKIRDTMTNARASGATQEEIAQQVQNVRNEQEQDLKRVLTPEQYEEYERTAAGGLIPPNMEGLGGMFPPGMFPGGG
jgi:predicted ATP-dependent serine protease